MFNEKNCDEFPVGNRSNYIQNLEAVCAENEKLLALSYAILQFGTHQKKSRRLERSLFLSFYEFKISCLDNEYRFKELSKQLGFITGSTHIYKSGRLFRLFCLFLQKAYPELDIPDKRWCTAFGAFADFAEQSGVQTIGEEWIDNALGGSDRSIRGWYDRLPKTSNHGRPKSKLANPVTSLSDSLTPNDVANSASDFAEADSVSLSRTIPAVVADKSAFKPNLNYDIPVTNKVHRMTYGVQLLSIDKYVENNEIICTIRLSNNPSLNLRDILSAALNSDFLTSNDDISEGGHAE